MLVRIILTNSPYEITVKSTNKKKSVDSKIALQTLVTINDDGGVLSLDLLLQILHLPQKSIESKFHPKILL